MTTTIEAMKQALKVCIEMGQFGDVAAVEKADSANAVLREAIKREEAQTVEPVVANNDHVICPNCCSQFRAIPVNVQQLMLGAGFEPPFTNPIKAQANLSNPCLFDKTALIEALRKYGDGLPFGLLLMRIAADMLAADAQEIAGWRADQKENLSNQMELQKQINDLKAQQVAVPQDTQPDNSDDLSIAYLSGLHEGKKRASALRKSGDAHEIWAAAQLTPGEGIADGVARVAALLDAPRVPMSKQWENTEAIRQYGEGEEP